MQQKGSSFILTQTWSCADALSIITSIFQLLKTDTLRKIRSSMNKHWETASYHQSVWAQRRIDILVGATPYGLDHMNRLELSVCKVLNLVVTSDVHSTTMTDQLQILSNQTRNNVHNLTVCDIHDDVNTTIHTNLVEFVHKQKNLRQLTWLDCNDRKSLEQQLAIHTFPKLQYFSYSHHTLSITSSLLQCKHLHTLKLSNGKYTFTEIRNILTYLPTLYKVDFAWCRCQYDGCGYPTRTSTIKQISFASLCSPLKEPIDIIFKLLCIGDTVQELQLDNFNTDRHIEDATQLLKLPQLYLLTINVFANDFTKQQIHQLSTIFQSHSHLSKVLIKSDIVLWSRKEIVTTQMNIQTNI